MQLLTNIKRIGKAHGLTLEQIGDDCGLSKNAIYRWDKNAPSVDRVKAVADYLGVTVDELLAEDESEGR